MRRLQARKRRVMSPVAQNSLTITLTACLRLLVIAHVLGIVVSVVLTARPLPGTDT